MWCYRPQLPIVDQATVDRLTAEIAALSVRILTLSAAASGESLVVSYTVNGRQVTKKGSPDPEDIPNLIRERNALLVALARVQAGGIRIFYGVPR